MNVSCLLIVGAVVWTPAGPQTGSSVLVRGEVIEAVGADAAAAEGCTRIEAGGKVLTPGFIDVHTDIGLSEVGMEAHTVDHQPRSKGKGVPLSPSFQVADAYNPRSTVIPITRIEGITSVLAVPSGGLIGGQSAWADLTGATQTVAVRRRSAAMHIRLGGGGASRARSLAVVRQAFNEAKWYAAKRGDVERRRVRPPLLPAADLLALAPVLSGKLPAAVTVNRASDIEALLRLKAEFNLNLIIVGGAEAWVLAKELAAAKVSVVVDPLLYGVKNFDQISASPANAALLATAGVRVILSAFWGHNARTLRQVAGNAIREGLPPEVAMKAVTENPADALGMPNHGRIAAGARANLVLWSADPFELSSFAEMVMIGGRRLPLVSRQTRLRDRYMKERPDGVVAPLALP